MNRAIFLDRDHPHDTEMASMVGSGSVYLLTGHGKKHLEELTIEPTFIADDIYEASLWIMGRVNPVSN